MHFYGEEVATFISSMLAVQSRRSIDSDLLLVTNGPHLTTLNHSVSILGANILGVKIADLQAIFGKVRRIYSPRGTPGQLSTYRV